MSAECSKCGHDLPYEGECEFCLLRSRLSAAEARADRAEEALKEIARAPGWSSNLSTRQMAREALASIRREQPEERE